MAALVVRHAGARHVVVTDVSEYRLELARKTGVTEAVNPIDRDFHVVMKDLGMKEGFDVGLEMSGAPAALTSMLDTMANGGRIALLGLPGSTTDAPFDWMKTITSMLTIKGIYGRDVRDLVRNVGIGECRTRHFPSHHASLPVPQVRGSV